jgi:hypothetical protein
VIDDKVDQRLAGDGDHPRVRTRPVMTGPPWSPRPDVLFDPVAAAHPVHRLAADPASAHLTTICVARSPAGRPPVAAGVV